MSFIEKLIPVVRKLPLSAALLLPFAFARGTPSELKIHGTVTDAGTAATIGGARVLMWQIPTNGVILPATDAADATATATTDVAAKFELQAPKAGTYILEVRATPHGDPSSATESRSRTLVAIEASEA